MFCCELSFYSFVAELPGSQLFALKITVCFSLSFGEFVPTQTNPLDNHTFVAAELNAMRQYYVQIVPMRFVEIAVVLFFFSIVNILGIKCNIIGM